MKKWKVLKTQDVSPSKWFPIIRHEVELSNGVIVDDYFTSPMGNISMVFPLTTDNKVVFVKQYKHALGEVVMELPAGFQQEGKTTAESALAELEEETGIRTTEDNLVFLGKTANIPTKIFNVTYLYFAKDLAFNFKQNLDETEEIEIVRVSPKKALEMVRSNEIWISDTVVTIMKVYFKYPELFKDSESL